MSAEPQLIVEMEVIGLDFDKLGQAMEDAILEGMDQLAKEIEREWREKASGQLNTSREKYLAGLSVERVGKDSVQASLSGFLPVAIEDGLEGYDMKPGTLGNALSRVIPIGKGAGGSPTFRTMKAGSDGWFHPGFQAKRISAQVQDAVDQRIKRQVFAPILSRVSV